MKKLLPSWKLSFFLVLLFVIISCGSDVVEEVIEIYESGNKKVFVRYHPDPNVLEKHFYNEVGEMIHLERDSLSYRYYFQNFMIGTWIMDKMMVDGEIMFEKDSVMNPDSLPNIYTFTSKKLMITGPQYSADYKIKYLDSTGVELDGRWIYGSEGEDTYRTERIYDIDYFQILSYYTILWSEFLEDTEKEEEVILRRVNIPVKEAQVDTMTIQDTDTLLIKQKETT